MNEAIAEHGALFHADGATIVPTELSRGPWYPGTLHGGPPSALLAWVLERHDPGPASFVARLTVELLRPVPMAPLRIEARTIRPGRKVQWLEAAVLADGVEVARATALRLRPTDAEVDAHEGDDPLSRLSRRRSLPSSSERGCRWVTGRRTISGL
ncbi:MAG: thioesterase family protein [Acidimicrobiia bacterium]|nr:thioesterase family protein [Acidimicrobiia bacterium]